jgi:hypothetical protein
MIPTAHHTSMETRSVILTLTVLIPIGLMVFGIITGLFPVFSGTWWMNLGIAIYNIINFMHFNVEYAIYAQQKNQID